MKNIFDLIDFGRGTYEVHCCEIIMHTHLKDECSLTFKFSFNQCIRLERDWWLLIFDSANLMQHPWLSKPKTLRWFLRFYPFDVINERRMTFNYLPRSDECISSVRSGGSISMRKLFFWLCIDEPFYADCNRVPSLVSTLLSPIASVEEDRAWDTTLLFVIDGVKLACSCNAASWFLLLECCTWRSVGH